VWGQRASPEIDHQRRADAIDQVGKIFAEIELGAAGHERKIPEKIGAGKLLWASSHDVKALRADGGIRSVHNISKPGRSVAFTIVANASMLSATRTGLKAR
jgi:hypothetical protein